MDDDIHAYIINLDASVERWRSVAGHFDRTGIGFTRIPAVNGRELQLPLSEFSETRYRLYHGKRTNKAEVGCYLSHIKCLDTLLASSHDFGIVCEDDIVPGQDLKELLAAAIRFGKTWDILRLSGYHNPHPVSYTRLPYGHALTVTFTRLCGSGAYMIHRRVAKTLIRCLLPMRVPFDHALDREWFYGLRAASITPLPIYQRDDRLNSQIDGSTGYRNLPWYVRYLTVFPYRAFNETARIVSRFGQLRRSKRAVRHWPRPIAA